MPKIPPKISIPSGGLLSWKRCYADVGDTITVYPLLPPGADPFQAEVVKVSRNRFGRISYDVVTHCINSGHREIVHRQHVFTEELVPEHHQRVDCWD